MLTASINYIVFVNVSGWRGHPPLYGFGAHKASRMFCKLALPRAFPARCRMRESAKGGVDLLRGYWDRVVCGLNVFQKILDHCTG